MSERDTAVAVAAVLAERRRQITAEGWTEEHDDGHTFGQLAAAAAVYAAGAASQAIGDLVWPWDKSWLKWGTPRRNLVKAAALIIAEIERLDRAEQRKNAHE